MAARSQIGDVLQSHPFWLLDVAPVGGFSLPIFTPIVGFATATAPEITVDLQEFPEGNWYFKRKVVKAADVATISLTRGARFWDADFWRWITFAVTGEGVQVGGFSVSGPSPRKDLLLVHFFSHLTVDTPTAAAALYAGLLTGLATGGGAASLAAQGLTALAAAALPQAGFEFAARLPARAWLLKNCIPVRYKAGTDFDASTGAVSIMELDIACEYFEEFSAAPAT